MQISPLDTDRDFHSINDRLWERQAHQGKASSERPNVPTVLGRPSSSGPICRQTSSITSIVRMASSAVTGGLAPIYERCVELADQHVHALVRRPASRRHAHGAAERGAVLKPTTPISTDSRPICIAVDQQLLTWRASRPRLSARLVLPCVSSQCPKRGPCGSPRNPAGLHGTVYPEMRRLLRSAPSDTAQ